MSDAAEARPARARREPPVVQPCEVCGADVRRSASYARRFPHAFCPGECGREGRRRRVASGDLQLGPPVTSLREAACAGCSRTFTYRHRSGRKPVRHCSAACRRQGGSRACAHCGAQYRRPPSTAGQYCSTKCDREAKRARSEAVASLPEKQCARCGYLRPRTEFVVSAQSLDGLFSYCNDCKRAARRESARRVRGDRPDGRKLRPLRPKRVDRLAITCEHCAVDFLRTAAYVSTTRKFSGAGAVRFCSRECHFAWWKRQAWEERTCEGCGCAFPFRVSAGPGRFCSRECRRRQVKKVCEHCGRGYECAACFAEGSRYCSRTCKAMARGAERTREKTRVVACGHCGKPLRRSLFRLGQRRGQFCSYECRGAAVRGANHHLWRGGRIESYGPSWPPARDATRTRDRYACKLCGVPKPDSRHHDVHHIVPFRLFGYVATGEHANNRDVVANDLSNLITLCRRCHKRAENDHVAEVVLRAAIAPGVSAAA
jgi:5-methylcytosine-specific restriction endonuclease McrA